MRIKTDFLVIGSGIAGLSFAIKAAKAGSVALVTKRDKSESATLYAQGGIASVFDKSDSFDDHIHDTIEAGAGLCDPSVVDIVVREGPEKIRELTDMGAHFTGKEAGGQIELDLGREGGHSRRRIVHAGDMTGREVEQTLLRAAEASENITIYEDHIAVDLLMHSKFVSTPNGESVWGAYVLDKRSGEIHTFVSAYTVLATGGAGKVYLFTSNPDISTGDGVAMACRAGADIRNMEFIQFHPTCLYHSRAKSFLISEALRGEGAILRLKDGTPFMKAHHPDAELAPRDIVARAIDLELKKRGDDCVYIDISHRRPEYVKSRFPNIYERCLSFGFDLTREPIPVVPAAHYLCGGVKTDTRGRTTIERLYAIGETACTGLHGANRLASNSLLECLVLASRAADDAVERLEGRRVEIPEIPRWETRGAVRSDEAVIISQNWDEIRRFMWNLVGIVRSDKRLEKAKKRINTLQAEINDYYWDFTVTSDLLELRNIATVAELIIDSASSRKESRGLHYNIDHPSIDKDFQRDTIIKK